MRDRPVGIDDRLVQRAVSDGWEIAATLEYSAVGGGSYHWVATGADGRRWFVTVDDLTQKGWLGATPDEVFDGLTAAMETAADLAWSGFVVAPITATDGSRVRRLDHEHALTVFEFVDG